MLNSFLCECRRICPMMSNFVSFFQASEICHALMKAFLCKRFPCVSASESRYLRHVHSALNQSHRCPLCTQWLLHRFWRYVVILKCFLIRFYPFAHKDATGKIRIWETTQKEHILKYEDQPISGKSNDIVWSPDSKRIAVCGEGREK